MKIRVQQRDGSIAEIWIPDRVPLTSWERSDNVNELIVHKKHTSETDFIHYFDEDGYLLPEKYRQDKDNILGTTKSTRIYIPPDKVKQ